MVRPPSITDDDLAQLRAQLADRERQIRRQLDAMAVVNEITSAMTDASTHEQLARALTEDLSRLTSSLTEGLPPSVRTEVRRGDPEDVIPEFVVAEGIDLVVMGTMTRGGLARWLIGNTAERVLRRLPCSVLTVRPDWFASMRPADPE